MTPEQIASLWTCGIQSVSICLPAAVAKLINSATASRQASSAQSVPFSGAGGLPTVVCQPVTMVAIGTRLRRLAGAPAAFTAGSRVNHAVTRVSRCATTVESSSSIVLTSGSSGVVRRLRLRCRPHRRHLRTRRQHRRWHRRQHQPQHRRQHRRRPQQWLRLQPRPRSGPSVNTKRIVL